MFHQKSSELLLINDNRNWSFFFKNCVLWIRELICPSSTLNVISNEIAKKCDYSLRLHQRALKWLINSYHFSLLCLHDVNFWVGSINFCQHIFWPHATRTINSCALAQYGTERSLSWGKKHNNIDSISQWRTPKNPSNDR